MTSASTGLHHSRPRLAHLDGVRALAALFVVVHHSFYAIYPPNTAEAAAAPSFMKPVTWGHLAVAAFLVVSGYSLTLGTLRHDGRLPRGSRQFFVRRFWRIVPTYWAALAFSILMGLTVLRHAAQPDSIWATLSVPVTLKDSLVHAVLLHDFLHPSAINYVLWSIAIEFHLYFLFPLVLWMCRRWNPFVMAAIAVVIGGGIGVAFRHTQTQGLLPQAHLLACFAFGVVACLVGHRGGTVTIAGRPVNLPWGLLAAAGLVLTVASHLVQNSPRVPDVLFALTVAALFIAIDTGRAEGARRALSWRPLVAVGLFSYSLYLLHPLVVQTVWWDAVRRLNMAPMPSFVLLAVADVVVAVAVAWLFFHAVEKHFLTTSKPRVPEEREVVEAHPA